MTLLLLLSGLTAPQANAALTFRVPAVDNMFEVPAVNNIYVVPADG